MKISLVIIAMIIVIYYQLDIFLLTEDELWFQFQYKSSHYLTHTSSILTCNLLEFLSLI